MFVIIVCMVWGWGKDLAKGQLVISGVFDGPLSGGLPKGIELYAVSDISDLSLYGVGFANNGGGTDGEEFTLSGSATAGDSLYVASEGSQFLNFFGFVPTFISGSANINGNDAIELFENGSVIDTYGNVNVNGVGEVWEYTDGWAYRLNGSGPDGGSFQAANWTFSGTNALDGFTTNAVAGIPVGTYAVPEPESYLLLAIGSLFILLRKKWSQKEE